VWTVHGVSLARHDAAAKARRDAALDQPSQGRVLVVRHQFGAPASTTSAASAATRIRRRCPPWLQAGRLLASRTRCLGAVITTLRCSRDGVASGGVADARRSTARLDDWAMATLGIGVQCRCEPACAARGRRQSAGAALTPTLTPARERGRLGTGASSSRRVQDRLRGDTAFDSSEAVYPPAR